MWHQLSGAIRLGFIWLTCLFLSSWAFAQDNIQFQGRLIKGTCTIRAGDEAQTIDFGPIGVKQLYRDGRTPAKLFSIHLDNCEEGQHSLFLTSNGLGSNEVTGGLMLDPSSQASGVVIALFMDLLGAAVPPIALVGPNGVYDFAFGDLPPTPIKVISYIQALPSALNSHTVEPGSFTATWRFTASYN